MEWMILPLKRYADFSGRSRRQEFWLYSLFVILLWLALFTAIGAIFGMAMGSMSANANPMAVLGTIGGGGLAVIGLAGILWLVLFIPGLAVSIRRMHDTGRSGWWAAAPTILYYGSTFVQAGSITNQSVSGVWISGLMSLAWMALAIAFLIFACLDGTRGPNRFGPDPKNPEANLNEVFS